MHLTKQFNTDILTRSQETYELVLTEKSKGVKAHELLIQVVSECLDSSADRIHMPPGKLGIPWIVEFFVQGLGFPEKRTFSYKNLAKSLNILVWAVHIE